MIASAAITQPLGRLSTALGHLTQALADGSYDRAMDALETATHQLDEVVTAIQREPASDGTEAELLLLIGKLCGRVPHEHGHETEGVSPGVVAQLAPAATLRRCDELLDAAGIEGA